MFVKTYSYRYAEEILQHPKYIYTYNEIIKICEGCPVPVYEGKSKKQKNKNVVQQIMNTYFKLSFLAKGWEEEPLATPENSEDALRSDFRKTFFRKNEGDGEITLQIEVEFGNVASAYRNYFKFQLSYSYNMTDVCILILPSQQLSTRIDSGVANFEKALREIPSAKLSITVPILIIGLFDRDENGKKIEEWDVKEQEENISVVKAGKKADYKKHLRLVNIYIDKLSLL